MKARLKKVSKKRKENEEMFRASQVGMLIEDFTYRLDLIYENQNLMEKRLESKMDEKIGSLENKMDKKIGKLESRMDEKIGSLENKMDENFNLVFEHFSNIEDELMDIKKELDKINENKIDEKEFRLLEIRVERLEQELKKAKIKARV